MYARWYYYVSGSWQHSDYSYTASGGRGRQRRDYVAGSGLVPDRHQRHLHLDSRHGSDRLLDRYRQQSGRQQLLPVRQPRQCTYHHGERTAQHGCPALRDFVVLRGRAMGEQPIHLHFIRGAGHTHHSPAKFDAAWQQRDLRLDGGFASHRLLARYRQQPRRQQLLPVRQPWQCAYQNGVRTTHRWQPSLRDFVVLRGWTVAELPIHLHGFQRGQPGGHADAHPWLHSEWQLRHLYLERRSRARQRTGWTREALRVATSTISQAIWAMC